MAIRLLAIAGAVLLAATFVSPDLGMMRTPAACAFGAGLFLIALRRFMESMATRELVSRQEAARTEWFPEESTNFDEAKQID